MKPAADTIEKLTELGDTTRFEPAGDQPQSEARSQRRAANLAGLMSCVSHVATPSGSKPILKAMVTTACEKNCFYCPFRAGRSSTHRVTFTPDEIAGAFDTLQRAGTVDGIFLSSGIVRGGVTSQDKIIDAAEILRRKYNYRGYVHLKIMPGAEYEYSSSQSGRHCRPDSSSLCLS